MIVRESFMMLPPIILNTSEVENWKLPNLVTYGRRRYELRIINDKAVVMNYGKCNYLFRFHIQL